MRRLLSVCGALAVALTASTAAGASPRATVGPSAGTAPSYGRALHKHKAHKHRAARPSVRVTRVTFTVANSNGSALTCPSDGASYRVRGLLVAPAKPAPGTSAATLYLHDFGFTGRRYWTFGAVPGYDFAAAMARAGHTSVLLDQLGYGASDPVAGNSTCLGAKADMAHQVLAALRGGRYSVDGGSPPAFARVALAGHGVGGAVAELEAYSFADEEALLVTGWADQGFSTLAYDEFGKVAEVCATGGDPSHPGYAYFGQTTDAAKAISFYDADPALVAAALAGRPPDACGDSASVPGAVGSNRVGVAKVTVPVLLALGDHDSLFPPPAGDDQKALFTGTKDIRLVTLPHTGNATSLERTAPAFRATVDGWLRANGF